MKPGRMLRDPTAETASELRARIAPLVSFFGQTIALMDIVSMMKDMSNHDIEVRVNPAFVRQNEVPRLVGSTSKLRALVNLPVPRPFVETLRRMYES